MLMLHSAGEWRISAAAALERLHVRPAAAAAAAGPPGPEEPLPNDGLKPSMMGRVTESEPAFGCFH